MRMRSYVVTILAACLSICTLAYAQNAASPPSDAGPRTDGTPVEPGIRFTPGLARSIAGQFVRNQLVRRYELDESRIADATELVARRLMKTAHALDGPGQELVQRFMEEQMAYQAEGGGGSFIPPGFGKEFAKRVEPMVPEIRSLCEDVGRDVAPLLSMKQRLKMAAEMSVLRTALDAFEENMKAWSTGKETNYDDPWGSMKRPVERDAQGEAIELKGAREAAAMQADVVEGMGWDRYVSQAKEYFGFDEAQKDTADAILADCKQRLAVVTHDEGWRRRYAMCRFWQQAVWRIPQSWGHPLQTCIEDGQKIVRKPIADIETDLKTRIDAVATAEQQKTAADRMAELLAKQGYGVTGASPATEAQP